MNKRNINKIFDVITFLIFSLFYIGFKCLFYNMGEVLTYIIILYGFSTFVYNFYKTYKKQNNLYSLFKNNKLLLISIGILFCGFIPLILRGISDFRSFAIFNSILFINLMLFLQTFQYKDKMTTISEYLLICSIVFFYTLIYSCINIILIITCTNVDIFGLIWGFDSGQRFQTCINSNMVAWIHALGIGCSFAMILYKKYKILPYINTFFSLIVIFFTQSKSALIGLFVALICVLLVWAYNNGKFKKYFIVAIVATTTLILLLILITSSKIFDIHLFTTGSNLIRVDIISYGLYVLMKVGILFGSGFGNLAPDWIKYNAEINNSGILITDAMPENSELVLLANAHNVFFQHLFNNGIVGLSLLVILFIYIFRKYILLVKCSARCENIDFRIIYIVTYFITFTFFISNFGMNTLYTITQFSCIFFFTTASVICNLSNASADV